MSSLSFLSLSVCLFVCLTKARLLQLLFFKKNLNISSLKLNFNNSIMFMLMDLNYTKDKLQIILINSLLEKTRGMGFVSGPMTKHSSFVLVFLANPFCIQIKIFITIIIIFIFVL